MKSFTPKGTGDQRCVVCGMYDLSTNVMYGYTKKGVLYSPVCQDCYNRDASEEFKERSKALDKLTSLGQELGLYNVELYYDENGRAQFRDKKPQVIADPWPSTGPHDPKYTTNVTNANEEE